MFKRILAGILSAVIVFSSLTPAVNATESVIVSQEETTDQEVVEEEITEEEKEEDKIEESAEEIEIPEEEMVETTIIEDVVLEEQTAQTMNTAAPIDESERTVIEEGTCGDNLTWVLYDDGELVISGEGAMDIGATYSDDYPWYQYFSEITKVVCEEGITSIGDYVFDDYYNLVSVSLPDSLKTIGEHSFEGCDLLENINWPKNLESIGKNAFAYCDGLTNITFPDCLSNIEESAFNDCDGLTEITLPPNLKILNKQVFGSCDNLKKVTILKGLTSISYYAFSSEYLEEVYYEGTWEEWEEIKAASDNNCGIYNYEVSAAYSFLYEENEDGTLTITGAGAGGIGGIVQIPQTIDGHTVTVIGSKSFANNQTIQVLDIPDSIKTIKKQAFYEAELRKLTFHEGLQCVEDYAFYSALGLESNGYYSMNGLVLPEGVTTIGKYAFAGANMSSQIEIPSTVTSIGASAFDWNESLLFKGSAQQWIDIHNADTDNYPPRENVSYTGDGCGFIKDFNDDGSYSYRLFSWTGASGKIEVPSTFRDFPVTGIDAFTFLENTDITEVVIPDSITYLDGSSFSGCSSLEKAEINAQINTLPSSLFYKCTSLTSVSLPHTITSINSNAFYLCTSLEEVYYDSSYNWENMSISEGNEALGDVEEFHFEHDWGYRLDSYWDENDNLIKFACIIGKTVISENLVIPDKLHGIPVKFLGLNWYEVESAGGLFKNNTTLKTVTLPQNLEYLNISTFKGCTNLTKVVLSENLKEIGTSAFEGCTNLTEIVLPEGLETIKKSAFKECTNLTAIVFPENLKEIEMSAFAGCTGLKRINIHKDIEVGAHAFEGCTGLERIVFAPEYDNGFSCHQFSGCIGVKEIVMPNENFSVWSSGDTCSDLEWEDILDSIFKGVPRNAKVKVTKNSTPYRRMVELGFTNLSVAIVLQNITLPSTVSVEQGKTKTVAVTKVPTNANDSLNLVWTSSDESIATVDANGVITGKKIGTTQISVKDLNSGKTAKTTVSVTVPAASVFSVNLHPGVDPLGLQKGQSVTMMITATLVDQLEPEMFTFTSSDDSVATVDENGVITAVSDEKSVVSVKITAKLNNDPYDRKFSVSVKTIPVQTEEIQIYAPNEELSDNQLILSKSKVADGDYEIQLRANPLDCNGVGTSTPLTWKSSNTKVATVAADGTVLVKKNANGVATITVTAKDQKMTSQSVLIDVRDYSPRLSVSTVTLNTNTDEEAQIEAYLTYGVELLNVRLEGDDRFYINRRSGEYGTVFNIGATEVVPKGTYKLKLVTESEGIGEVVQNFTIKVVNKVPSVTVKQINAFNLFYTDSTADVSVTAKDIAVKNVMLEDTESFQGIFNEETGILNVSYGDENAVLDKKATLVIELEGYREPVTKAFNVNAKETKPTLTPSRKNTKLSVLTTEGIPLQIIDKETNEPINWENCSVDILETSTAYVECTYKETDLILSPILNDAYKFVNNKTSHVAKLEVWQDNWKKPLTVIHSIAVNAAIPTIKAQNATLTLNSLFGNSAETILIPNVLNCPEPIGYIPEAVIENENTEKLDIEVEGWNLTARFKDIEDVPVNGSYKYKVKAIIPGFDAEETIVIPVTIKVASTIPKVTLGKTSISLNKTITDNMNVSVTAATGFEVTNAKIEKAAGNLLTEEQLAVTFDETTKLLTAVVLDPGIPNGTYKYTVTPKVKMNGVDTDEVETKALTLSVKVYEGNPQVKTSAAGSIDLLTRGTGITYTVTGGTKFNYDVSKMVTDEISLTGLDADRFNLEVLGENQKGQPQILITAKEDAEFTTTEICKIQISFVMDGISERIQTTELKFKPKQSTLSVAVGGNTTIYTGVGAGKITLDVKKPVDAQIAAVEILDTKATTVPEGAIWFQIDKENGRYVINYYIEDVGKLKVGASYKLALAITPDGNANNKVAQTVSVALKVQR